MKNPRRSGSHSPRNQRDGSPESLPRPRRNNARHVAYTNRPGTRQPNEKRPPGSKRRRSGGKEKPPAYAKPCPNSAIPGQIRCEDCRNKHRARSQQYDAKRREEAKNAASTREERRTVNGIRETCGASTGAGSARTPKRAKNQTVNKGQTKRSRAPHTIFSQAAI